MAGKSWLEYITEAIKLAADYGAAAGGAIQAGQKLIDLARETAEATKGGRMPTGFDFAMQKERRKALEDRLASKTEGEE